MACWDWGPWLTCIGLRTFKLDTAVALKVIRGDRADDSEFLRRALAEQRIYAQLRNPHLIRTLEAGEQDGLTFFATELVHGIALSAQIQSRGPLAPLVAARVVAQVASALDEAHKKGVVHRDVKPTNILVDYREDGPWANLQDFGLADDGSESVIQYPGTAVGTMDYMAPEAIRGEDVDPRSDVWGLGASLFEMLTGSAPFAEKQGMKLPWAILTDPAPRVTALAPNVPAAFDAVVERAMAKDINARFQSAGALGEAALNAAGPRTLETEPEPNAEHELPQHIPVSSGDAHVADGLDAVEAELPYRGSSGRAPWNVFLCYRREDTRWVAGSLADALRNRFGADNVFVDVDRARVGNWRERVNDALATSAAMLVLIGPGWLEEIEKRAEIEDEVRYEIGSALSRGTAVVPVTVGQARVPDRDSLPPDIAPIADQEVNQLGEDRLWRPTLAILLDDLAAALQP